MQNTRFLRANAAVKEWCDFSVKKAESDVRPYNYVCVDNGFIGKITVLEDVKYDSLEVGLEDGFFVTIKMTGKELAFTNPLGFTNPVPLGFTNPVPLGFTNPVPLGFTNPVFSDACTITVRGVLNGEQVYPKFAVEFYGVKQLGDVERMWLCAFLDIPNGLSENEYKKLAVQKYREAYEKSEVKNFVDRPGRISKTLVTGDFFVEPCCTFSDLKLQLYDGEDFADVYLITDGEILFPWISPEKIISFGRPILDPYCKVHVKITNYLGGGRDVWCGVYEFDEFTHGMCLRIFL